MNNLDIIYHHMKMVINYAKLFVKLFCQCKIHSEILNNSEIYRIIDSKYSYYYPKFIKDDTFRQAYINYKNEEIKTKLNKIGALSHEISNIIKYNNRLPFPLINDYLKSVDIELEVQYANPTKNIYNLYCSCFSSLNPKYIQEFFKNYEEARTPTMVLKDDIKKIIYNKNFTDLIKEIMISPVMKDAYKRIYVWYATFGEFGINKEKILEEYFQKENENIYNLINGKSILYNDFVDIINNLYYSKLFIIMALPKEIKGFIFPFLKIIINSEGIELKNNKLNLKSKTTLLKAYLIFVIIHEINYFMKRYLNLNKSTDLFQTSVLKDDDEDKGGKQLINLLFSKELIKQYLNLEQAEYILNIKNWQKESVDKFKKDFTKIKTSNKKDDSIIYLYTENKSYCDHSMLFA